MALIKKVYDFQAITKLGNASKDRMKQQPIYEKHMEVTLSFDD